MSDFSAMGASTPPTRDGAASQAPGALGAGPPMAGPPMVEIRGLTRRYRDLVAVRDLNLSIGRGEIFGFIGPNGAGKTTTIKTLATLLEPSSGTVLVNGIDVVKRPLEVRRIIGYMPDSFGVYDDVRVWEYLDFFAAAYRIAPEQRPGLINDVLELTDLSGKREAFVEGLSRGMKQRLCLAKTLVHDPALLLLDEPASGLDPRARIEFRALLKELRAMGKTIFVSSHILPELADFCTSIGIMERGQLVVAGSVEAIIARLEDQVVLEIAFAAAPESAQAALESGLEVARSHEMAANARIENAGLVVEWSGGRETLPSLLKTLVEHGLPVASFAPRATDLEDVFLKVTRGAVQ